MSMDVTGRTEEELAILVVEDDPCLLEAFAAVLRDRGFRVTEAPSGDAALASIRRGPPPDLIITDVILPGLDGFSLLASVAEELGPRTPPAIVCSGFEFTETEARRLGAAMFLHKPLDREALLWAVELVIAGTQIEPRLERWNRQSAAAARYSAHAKAVVRATEIVPADLERHGKAALEWLRVYFDCDSAYLCVPRNDSLVALAGAGPVLVDAAGGDLERLAEALTAVMETSTSLLIGDLTRHPAFGNGARDASRTRFVVAVPLSASTTDANVGVLCMTAAKPRSFCAEDLAVLEHLGRRGGMVLDKALKGQTVTDERLMDDTGTLNESIFHVLLDHELLLLRRQALSLELLTLGFANSGDSARAAATLAKRLRGQRIAIGHLGDTCVGVFAHLADHKAATVAELDLQDVAPGLQTAVSLELRGGRLPHVTASMVLQMTRELLQNGEGTSAPKTRMSIVADAF